MFANVEVSGPTTKRRHE